MTKGRLVAARASLKLGVAAMSFIIAAAASAQAAPIRLDAPTQPLAATLKQIGRQAKVEILFASSDVRGAQAAPLKGNFSVDQALASALAGTPLHARRTAQGAYVVEADKSAAGRGEAASAAAVSGGASVAAAESAATDPATGNEIVVTALHRRDRLQNVPASVGVITGAQLREQNANSYRDYLNAMPSVSYVSNGAYRDKIFIRGVAEGLSATTLATTGLYVDEVALSEVQSGLSDVSSFDIERVEVLRGPQGTLYGAGSMGGTVRIITAKPKIGRVEALGESTLSFTEHGGTNYALNAAVNLPIASTLALRVVAGRRHDSGFVNNIAPNVMRSDVNGQNHTSLRAQALFQPTEDFSILAGFQFQKDDIHQGNVQDIGNPRNVTRRYPEFSYYNTKIYSLTINKHFSFASLISATNYIDKTSFTARDSTVGFAPYYTGEFGTPVPANEGLGLLNRFPNRQFSQEVRLSSNGTGRLSWLIGGYYSNYTPTNSQVFDTVAAPALATVDFFTGITTIHRRNLSGFGEISYKLFDKLELTAGYRRTNVRTTNDILTSGVVNANTTTIESQRYSETAGTQKYRISYKPTATTLIYVQAAQGFRPGAPLGTFPTACDAELSTLGFASPPTQYNSDSLWDYELGTKNSLFGNKLTLNATIYHIDWDNIQAARNLACAFQFVSNVGKVKTNGVELEMTAHPMHGLDLTGSASYTDAKLKSSNSAIGARNGDPVPNVPKWTLAGSARYQFALSDKVDAFVRGDVSYLSSRWSDFKGLPFPRARNDPGYAMVGLRAGIDKGIFEGSIFVTNLFDKNAIINTMNNNALLYNNIVQPRVIGATLKVRY